MCKLYFVYLLNDEKSKIRCFVLLFFLLNIVKSKRISELDPKCIFRCQKKALSSCPDDNAHKPIVRPVLPPRFKFQLSPSLQIYSVLVLPSLFLIPALLCSALLSLSNKKLQLISMQLIFHNVVRFVSWGTDFDHYKVLGPFSSLNHYINQGWDIILLYYYIIYSVTHSICDSNLGTDQQHHKPKKNMIEWPKIVRLLSSKGYYVPFTIGLNSVLEGITIQDLGSTKFQFFPNYCLLMGWRLLHRSTR